MNQRNTNQNLLRFIAKTSNESVVDKSKSATLITDKSQVLPTSQLVTEQNVALSDSNTLSSLQNFSALDMAMRKTWANVFLVPLQSLLTNRASPAERANNSDTGESTSLWQNMSPVFRQNNISPRADTTQLANEQHITHSQLNSTLTSLLALRFSRHWLVDMATIQEINDLASETASQADWQTIINLLASGEKSGTVPQQSVSLLQNSSQASLQANKQQLKIPRVAIGQNTESSPSGTTPISQIFDLLDIDQAAMQKVTAQASQAASQVYLQSVLTSLAAFAEKKGPKVSTSLWQSMFSGSLQENISQQAETLYLRIDQDASVSSQNTTSAPLFKLQFPNHAGIAPVARVKSQANFGASEIISSALTAYGFSQVDSANIIDTMPSKSEYTQPNFRKPLVDTGVKTTNTENTNVDVDLDHLSLKIESSLERLHGRPSPDLDTAPQAGQLEPLIGELRADFAAYKKRVEQQLRRNVGMGALLDQESATSNSANADAIRLINSNPLSPQTDQKSVSHGHERETQLPSYDPNKWLPIEDAANKVGLTRRAVNRIVEKGYVESRTLPTYTKVDKTYVSLPDLFEYRMNPPKGGRPRKDNVIEE